MGASIGWAEFDALGSRQTSIGWAEFDTRGVGCFVGWAELDCLSPNDNPVPPFIPGGGTTRYHSAKQRRYDIPVDVDEDEEEQIVLQILMEIAAREL